MSDRYLEASVGIDASLINTFCTASGVEFSMNLFSARKKKEKAFVRMMSPVLNVQFYLYRDYIISRRCHKAALHGCT